MAMALPRLLLIFCPSVPSSAARRRAAGRARGTAGVGAVAAVEPAGDEPRDLEVGQLVAADRHQGGLAEQDVGGLVDGVREHEAGHRRQPRGRELVLDRRVARELRDADQAQERHEQPVERLDLGVGEDRRPVGVDADGEVVGHERVDVLGQRRRAVAVDDGLEIGDEDHEVRAVVLQPHAVLQRAEVVAQVQRAGRAVAGQDATGFGMGHAVLLGVCGCPGERVSSIRCDRPLARAAGRHGCVSRAALEQPPPARVCAAAHAPSVDRGATLRVCVRGGPSRR